MIVLPWPPSLNRYYRTHRGRVLISKEGRDYRQLVMRLSLAERWPCLGDSRVKVVIDVYPPDRRRRDLDNLQKCLCDSLEAANVIDNDSQIDDLHIRRQGRVKEGRIEISVEKVAA